MYTKDDERCVNPNKTLGIDEACLSILNERNAPQRVYASVNECRGCDSLLFANLSANSNTTVVVPTRYALFMHDGTRYSCREIYQFGEHGHYGWNFTSESCSDFYVLKEPSNPYIPILKMFFVGMVAIGLYLFMTKISLVTNRLKALLAKDQSDLATLQDPEPEPPLVSTSQSRTRIHSIDTFRGIAVLMMIFVNNGGGEYVFFNPSAWYGLTVADLVLPWFAWIMGLTLVVSLQAQLRTSVSRPRIVLRILRRSLLLVLFGLIINSSGETTLADLRFPGVLQLLGITYFICATIEAVFMKAQGNYDYGRFMFLQDILNCWPQWIIVAALTATHTLITLLLPVPGCLSGSFTPGGYNNDGGFANCTAGAAGYIDRLVFGRHIYNKTDNPIYGPTLPYDPEGIMNTLSAVLLVALGVQAGRILLCYYLHLRSKMLRWLSWAGLTGIFAGFLGNWSLVYGDIPICRNMMTLSFVLLTSSFAFILFAILYYLVDHKRMWNGAPFVYAGMNPIFLYMGHYLTMNHFPWAWKIVHPTHGSLLYMNVWTTTLWALIAYAMYRKNIIVTI